jgi:hypothetical protein
MTPATNSYTWPVPSPADTARALAGISGDIRRGLPPKLDEALIFLAAVRAGTTPDPGQPVPFTLTAKALALLDQVPEDQRACERCGAAWFGTPPDDGLCPGCSLAGGARQ